MLDRLFRRPEQFAPLSDAKKQVFAEATDEVREVAADPNLMRGGEADPRAA